LVGVAFPFGSLDWVRGEGKGSRRKVWERMERRVEKEVRVSLMSDLSFEEAE